MMKISRNSRQKTKNKMKTPLPIQIFSIYKIQEVIDQNLPHYSHCISIGDPGTQIPDNINTTFSDVLRLEFHDINSKRDMPAGSNPVTPKMKDIKKTISFYNRTKTYATGYTIHCHAGVHRSVAIGFILLYLMYGSIETAKEQLIKIRAFPLPNRRMISLFDRLHGSGLISAIPELEERLKGFLNGQFSINHDDYLEEL